MDDAALTDRAARVEGLHEGDGATDGAAELVITPATDRQATCVQESRSRASVQAQPSVVVKANEHSLTDRRGRFNFLMRHYKVRGINGASVAGRRGDDRPCVNQCRHFVQDTALLLHVGRVEQCPGEDHLPRDRHAFWLQRFDVQRAVIDDRQVALRRDQAGYRRHLL